MTLRRILLQRRRWDPLLLGGGMACLSLLVSAGKAAFLFFAVCGLYLVLVRPRTLRGAPTVFMGVLAAWALWQVGLSLLRGEPLGGNRVLSYAGLEFACALLPLGLGLVRRPAQVLAWGARIGVIALVVLTPVEYAMTGMRVGLGKNEAIFAFVVGAVAVLARLPTNGRFRLLPDGRFWTYLAAVPIVLSGTRAAMLLFVIVALLDLRRLVPHLRAHGRRAVLALILGLVAALAAVVPVGGFLVDRIESGVAEMEAYEATGLAVGSVDTRMAMWSSAVRVLAAHPMIGVGGMERMAIVAENAGPNAKEILRYQHLHNIVLDEALSSGLVGLALLVATMAAFLAGALRLAHDPVVRDASVTLVAFTFVFGFFHGVLLNEWMVLVIFSGMGIILVELRARAPSGVARREAVLAQAAAPGRSADRRPRVHAGRAGGRAQGRHVARPHRCLARDRRPTAGGGVPAGEAGLAERLRRRAERAGDAGDRLRGRVRPAPATRGPDDPFAGQRLFRLSRRLEGQDRAAGGAHHPPQPQADRGAADRGKPRDHPRGDLADRERKASCGAGAARRERHRA